jgi:hypothetical protein
LSPRVAGLGGLGVALGVGVGVGLGVGVGGGVGLGLGVGFGPSIIGGGVAYPFGQIDPIMPAETTAIGGLATFITPT